MAGMIRRTRRSTEAKIIAQTVTSAARGTAKIAGRETFELLDRLVAATDERGKKLYRKCWIAKELGSKTPGLQVARDRSKPVRADKAKAIRELYDRLWASDERLRLFVDPTGQHRREAAAKTEFANKPQSVPLSKRDPAIKRRWDDLFRNLA